MSRRVTVLGLLLVALAFVVLVGVGLSSAVVYYRTPTELLASPTFTATRLYGLVVPGSVRVDEAARRLTFRVTDGSASVAVESTALPTALFRDGVGVVLEGRLASGGVFVADAVLVKHSEVYQALRPGQTVPPGVVDSLDGAAP
ncbi:MAG: cytochrome c maturation protein CcmE [Candidatus Limnocylindrales bacterium]